MPEKVVSFTGREVDEMTEHEDDDGYVNEYEDYEERDYYLPQDGIQLESERASGPKKMKQKENFQWFST